MKWMIAALLCLPLSAVAEDGLNSGDTAWILASTALVLFMTCLLYTSPSPRDS